MFGTGELFTLVHSGRVEALPSRWKDDTPTRYSALLQEAGVHEWTSISLRDGRMLAGGDGTVMTLTSLAPDELYIASMALSVLHKRSENVKAPYIVLMPSTLRPTLDWTQHACVPWPEDRWSWSRRNWRRKRPH